MTDTKLLSLVKRIRCVESEEATRTQLESMLCIVTVKLANGDTRTERVEFHRGSLAQSDVPPRRSVVKFHDLAEPFLGKQRSVALIEALWKIDEMDGRGQDIRACLY